MGQMFGQQEKNPSGGDRRSDHRSNGSTGDQPTLDDLGVSKSQSSYWQKLAEVSDCADRIRAQQIRP